MDPLLEAALAARDNAHAPFSNFKSAPPSKTSAGRIHTGCNVENATYGLTVAPSASPSSKPSPKARASFRRIAVAADTDTLTPPCGACRQILWEFCGDIESPRQSCAARPKRLRLKDLFPRPFDASFL